ncbi:putative protocadherin beta-18 [Saccostrea echinata]|uniref:putative protocadherin beta-18 n=1 Tax=Saccostrea echinata TaxID=191078 RepID=UPI002A7F2178|nr:putative protocadherin beta-18 [Saccostrea echinata]XP_061164090.1 putative protocadherin beta-18 [Saccostrea echinata]
MGSMLRNLWILLIFVTCCGSVDIVYNITEEQGANVTLGNIFIDAKLGEFHNDSHTDKLKYSFLSQPPHYFAIDPETSDFKTAMNLDREKICPYKEDCTIPLEIAVQSEIAAFFEKIIIMVNLLDINDKTPAFPNSSTNLRISEGAKVNKSFVIDGAIDQDSEEYSVKRYEVRPKGTPFDVIFFRNLDDSLSVKLKVIRSLDREETSHYDIQILAYDGGSPPKVGMMRVNVTIGDINDNNPVFDKSIYNVTVKEEIAVNTTILQLRATDKDIGKNGEILYKISTNQPEKLQGLFFVNENTGELKIAKQLIYEPSEKYRLIVEAYDKGEQPYPTQAIVNVYVQDSGNNPPEIKINLLTDTDHAQVSEYANRGAVVAHIRVIDNDAGANGIVSCNISNNQFTLQKLEVQEYKVTVDKPMDREAQDEHFVIITCQDIGSPPLSCNASFRVKVTDENDQEPRFSQNEYHAKIPEGNNPGDAIIQILATDNDLGNNARIHYKLHGDAGADFRVDEDTGTIRANKVYDRESVSQYRFRVYAVDSGDPPLSSTATIVVNIEDKNDNFPEFTQNQFKASVQENVPFDTFVLQLTATDKDSGDNGKVSFSLPKHSEIPFFLAPNGTILVNGNLNREEKDRYIFTAIASDHGNPPNRNSVVIQVDITDANDNEPIIVFPNASNDTVKVSVNLALNTIVAQIQAFDIDEGENKTLVYSIAKRNDSDIFNINSLTGEVIVARTMHPRHIASYFLTIAVSDKGVKPLTKYENLHLVVVKTNATTSGMTHTTGDDELNMRIVVAVVVVTLVLSASILLTIFFVRRRDLKRKELNAQTEAKANTNSCPRVYVDPPKYVAPGQNVGMFYSDETDEGGRRNHQNMYQLSDPTVNMDKHTRSESPNDEARQSELNRMASIRLHQKLVQTHDKQWPVHSSEYNKERPDNHSDTSGETIQSDSGVGISEGETRSTMSHSHHTDDLRNKFGPSQNGRRGTPPHLSNNVRYQNLSYSQPPPLYENVMELQQYSKMMGDTSHHLPVHVRTFYQPKTSVSPTSSIPSYGHFSSGLYTARSVDETIDSVVTGYNDDDTTTSGSYTIDEDEEDPVEVRLQKVPDVFV